MKVTYESPDFLLSNWGVYVKFDVVTTQTTGVVNLSFKGNHKATIAKPKVTEFMQAFDNARAIASEVGL